MAKAAKFKRYNGSAWEELTFTPSSHTHALGDITGLLIGLNEMDARLIALEENSSSGGSDTYDYLFGGPEAVCGWGLHKYNNDGTYGSEIDRSPLQTAYFGEDLETDCGVLMNWFRTTVFGLGTVTAAGWPWNGKMSARGKFLKETDATHPVFDYIELWTDYQVYPNNIDSMVVECIGGEMSEAECTMTIDLYTKDAKRWYLQVCAVMENSATTFVTDGWQQVSYSGGGSDTSGLLDSSAMFQPHIHKAEDIAWFLNGNPTNDVQSMLTSHEDKLNNLQQWIDDDLPGEYAPIDTNKFKLLGTKTLTASGYMDLSTTNWANYNELMVIVRTTAAATIGIDDSSSASSTGFGASKAVSGTVYSKITMNKTSDSYYAWDVGGSLLWTSSTTYKYVRVYTTASSISVTIKVYGR